MNTLPLFHGIALEVASFRAGNFDFVPILAALQRGNYVGFLSVKVYREPWMDVAAASLRFLRAQLPGG